ncbi:MAG: HAD family hydrolase [Fidelibacterota bacterium]
MKVKHIIWDWNGTLLDDLWLSIEAINCVLRRYDLPEISREKYLEIFTFPVIDYYRQLGFDFDRHPFEQVGTEFIAEYTRRQLEPALHSDARSTLARFAWEGGLGQSLLTAATQEMAETLVDYHELGPWFDRVVGQDNHYAYGKEKAGAALLNELGLRHDEVMFIGDTVHDLDVARAMDVSCLLVSRGHTSHERLVATKAPVFYSLSQCADYIFHHAQNE